MMAKPIHHRAARAVLNTLPLAAMTLVLNLSAPVVQARSIEPPATIGPDRPDIAQTLLRQAPGLTADALRLALRAVDTAAREGLVTRRDLLTVIDYSLPSTQPRLFVFDLAQEKLLYRELVAHGVNSGDNLTTRFSNVLNSRATSIGLFVTADTYFGSNGYSLRLRGLDRGFNDQALVRAIVMHGAPYVNESITRNMGRLGRSWGCPALPAKVSKKIIDHVKGGSPIFAYYPDPDWLRASRFLKS